MAITKGKIFRTDPSQSGEIDYIDEVNSIINAGGVITPDQQLYQLALDQYNQNIRKGIIKRLEVPKGFCGYIKPITREMRVVPAADFSRLTPGEVITLSPQPSAGSVGAPHIAYPIDLCLEAGLPGSKAYSDCQGSGEIYDYSGITWQQGLSGGPIDYGGASIAHRASFLFDDASTRVMNILRDGAGTRAAIISRCRRNGDDAMYIFLSNYGDGFGGNPRISIYGDSSSDFGRASRVNSGRVNSYRSIIKNEIMGSGLRPIFWLFADDSSAFTGQSTSVLQQAISDMVANFDDLALAYVLALEATEYWSSSKTATLATHLRTRTHKNIGLHLNIGIYTWSRDIAAVDTHYHQYGWGNSPSEIMTKTIAVKAALGGKPIVAAEYNRDSDTSLAKAQGQAAIAGGAIGTGNGR